LPQLPVGQHEVKNWPVLDLGEVPEVDRKTWKLEVGGLVEHPLTMTWDQFLELPQADDVSDFHCVTAWSRHDNHWRGVRFKTIAELAVPAQEACFVLCTGYDFAPGTLIPYTTNLPLARAIEDDVLLVHTWEGRPLPHEHGGPVRMITPKLYAWKGTKWIRKIEFLAHDQKGFWEVRGYSNSAEPWYNDRYSTGD
jgi:DMSO/TMAO reductase YedYZ molybdopterin-dependent catalytic subunit